MKMKPTVDCVAIAKAGGGLDLSNSNKTTADLILIAEAASKSGAQIWVSGTKMTSDLIEIAAAGKGCVMVRFD